MDQTSPKKLPKKIRASSSFDSFKMLRRGLFWKYLRYFFRKIKMQKEYAALNILSLTLGIACLIFVFLWMDYERSYDTFHDKQERVFLVLTRQNQKEVNAYSTLGLGPALIKDFEEIEDFCRIRFKNASLVGARFYEQNFYLADPSIFQIFTFPFVRGNPETALADLNSIVITEKTAARYFGDKNPLGQTLNIRQFNAEFKITGVVQDPPSNSHIHFDLVASIGWMENTMADSKEPACFTYLLLRPDASSQQLDRKIRLSFHKSRNSESHQVMRLEPLIRIHRDGWDEDASSKQLNFYFLIALAIWILACINFVILSTARFIKNAREVGIRKICGAPRSQIVIQYVMESIIFSCLASLPAVLLILLILPIFNHYAGKELSLVSGNIGFFLVQLGIIIPALSFLGGFYPAFALSSIRPEQTLKGMFSLDKQGFRFKKILLIFQFSVAIGLILCSFIVFKQLRLIKEKGLGFARDSIVVVPNQIPLEQFKETLIKDPNITNITAASVRPFQVRDEVTIRLVGQPENMSFSAAYSMVDFEFFKTFEMEILEGRDFLKNEPWDLNRTCIINESAVRKLGLNNPVGNKIYFDHPAFAEEYKNLMIIGVVKDNHSRSMHQTTGPFVFRFYRPWHYLVFIKIKPGNIQKTLPRIEQTFKEFNGRDPFYFEFLEDAYSHLYRSEVLMGWFFNTFGLSAVLISLIGLFGLVSYSAEHKTREIGIRKIFGASATGLVFYISKELMSCVFLANIIAWPIVLFIMKKWLENYAWRTPLGFGIFLPFFLSTMFLALLTASSKIVKIIQANPIDSLKYE